MQGHFDIYSKFCTPDREAQILAMPAEERWAALMALETDAEVHKGNLLFDMCAAFWFNRVMGGGNITDPWDFDSGSSLFSTMQLSTKTGPPDYKDELVTTTADMNVMPEGIGASSWSAKRFYTERVQDPVCLTLQDGREGFEVVWRWLWRTTEGNGGSDIRSFSPWMCQDGDQSIAGYWRGKTGRVELVDGGGTPIALTKDSSKVLAAQYTITLLSI